VAQAKATQEQIQFEYHLPEEPPATTRITDNRYRPGFTNLRTGTWQRTGLLHPLLQHQKRRTGHWAYPGKRSAGEPWFPVFTEFASAGRNGV